MNDFELGTIRQRMQVDMVRAICPKCQSGTLEYIPGQQLSGPVKKFINHICDNAECKNTVILDKFFPFLDEAKRADLAIGDQYQERVKVARLGR